jgi:hypothetical protein
MLPQVQVLLIAVAAVVLVDIMHLLDMEQQVPAAQASSRSVTSSPGHLT